MIKVIAFLKLLFFVTLSTIAVAQNSDTLKIQKEIKHQYVGSSLSKILFTTLINANYSFELNKNLTPYAEGGYGINVAGTSTFTMFTHETHTCSGYQNLKISGGFVKLGIILNLREDLQKRCFTHIGIFFNNALVSEKAEYYNESESRLKSHTVYVPALSIATGLDVKIWRRLWSNFDIQFSFPGNIEEKMYGYSIPGMGGSPNGQTYIMFTFNLKYQLPL